MVGCTNPYAKFYTDLSGGVGGKGAPFIETFNGEPYVATYWIKRKSGGWGIYCKDLTPEQRREAGSNKGVLVANLANNGSAYDANILPGDIIVAIYGKELRGCGDYDSVAASAVGRDTDVALIRNGERMTVALFVRPYS
jgi:S1-C subfamily serine protease